MDKGEILRKASELTKAIDSQFSYILAQRDEPSSKVHQFASVFHSPVPTSMTGDGNYLYNEQLTASGCEVVVKAGNGM